MSVNFCSIASGSNGNCIYIGSKKSSILIDAGLSGKKISESLTSISEDISSVKGIFITHEHSDHILGAGILSRRYNIPIYATEKTWDAMENTLGKIKPYNQKYIYAGEECFIDDICVNSYAIPHDARGPVGYNIFIEDKKISVATDIGHVTSDLKNKICDSDILLIESNHDLDMLINGSYPQMLKNRVMGDYGHLSNITCGFLLAEIMTSRIKHIYLGHLSGENNKPTVAYETVTNILESKNIDLNKINLMVASRGMISKPLLLA